MLFLGLKGRTPCCRVLSALLGGAATLAMAASPAAAAPSAPSIYQVRNLFGSVGLIDMPSARMAPDGELSAGASFFERNERFQLGFQVLPWLETSFRYSGLSRFDPQFPVYFDRSFAFKLRLLQEGEVVPALAIGVNDAVGTGVYGGEYIVASKQFGAVDATVGLGWGRLATNSAFKNPLSIFSNAALNPRSGYNTPGGTNINVLFRGPRTGVFGGLTWDTPVDGLLVTAEYSSDAYTAERASGNLAPKTQFNVGASYQVLDSTTLSLDYLYGRAVSAAVSFQLSPVQDTFPQRMGPQPPQPYIRPPEQQRMAIARLGGRPPSAQAPINSAALVDALWNRAIAVEDITVNGRTLVLQVGNDSLDATCQAAARVIAAGWFAIDRVRVQRGGRQANCVASHVTDIAYSAGDYSDGMPLHSLLLASSQTPRSKTPAQALSAIRKGLTGQNIQVEALSIRGADLFLYYANGHYRTEADALDRIVRVLTNEAPPEVERFVLVPTLSGVPQRQFSVLRSPTERSYDQTGSYDVVTDSQSTGAPMRNPVFAAAVSSNYPRLSWSVFPQFRQELFDPSNPFAVQLLGGAGATLEVLPGLSLQGVGEISFYDNFNVLRPPSSALPHVRSDFLKYFSQGKNGIADLEVDYRFRLAPNVFATVRAGYLESMFAGVGGEILWRPENQRWSLGVDLYGLRQREYDRLFGLRDYQVYTGHVSLNYASPWYGLNFAVRVGRYLAGDRGFTFEVTRRFDSGVEIGAFFTKTNVPAALFGEGSFDKGIMIRLPLDWMVPINTQSELSLDLRPVQRDGGQRLANDTTLYQETRRASQVEMIEHDTASVPH